MFDSSLQLDKPSDQIEEIKNRQIEGTKLALLTPADMKRSIKDSFIEYFMIFYEKYIVVTQGYSRRHVINFNEVFAPVSKWDTIRTILAVGANQR